jgi:hypothetical protein
MDDTHTPAVPLPPDGDAQGTTSGLATALAWCSGAHASLVQDLPEERNRLASIGATVLFTGLFATISSAYALHAVFGWGIWVPVLGLAWGTMIFNLDRMIVMTIGGSVGRKVLSAIPRVFLATVISVVIARPLELWIFKTEIDRAVALADVEAKRQVTLSWERASADAQVRYETAVQSTGSSSGVEAAQAAYNTAQAQATACAQEISAAADEWNTEINGKGGTGQKGDGPVAQKKKAHLEGVVARCSGVTSAVAAARTALDGALTRQSEAEKSLASARQAEISQATTVRDAGIAALDATRADSLLGRHQQLSRLSRADPAVFNMNIFLMTLFWLVEVLPIAVKLMGVDGAYEARVAQRRGAALAAAKGASDASEEILIAAREAERERVVTYTTETKALEEDRRKVLALHHRAVADTLTRVEARWRPREDDVQAAVTAMENGTRVAMKAALGVAGATTHINSHPKSSTMGRSVTGSRATPILHNNRFTSALVHITIIIVSVGLAFLAAPHITPFDMNRGLFALAVGGLLAAVFALKPWEQLWAHLALKVWGSSADGAIPVSGGYE